jgi:hypothetical protein
LVRKRGIALLPGETLFLRGGNNFAVPEKAGGAIVVVGRETQDI